MCFILIGTMCNDILQMNQVLAPFILRRYSWLKSNHIISYHIISYHINRQPLRTVRVTVRDLISYWNSVEIVLCRVSFVWAYPVTLSIPSRYLNEWPITLLWAFQVPLGPMTLLWAFNSSGTPPLPRGPDTEGRGPLASTLMPRYRYRGIKVLEGTPGTFLYGL